MSECTTPTMSRRAAARRAAALPFLELVMHGRAAAADNPDAALLQLGEEMAAVEAECRPPLSTDIDDDEFTDLLAEYWEIVDKIEDTPARTPAGIALKVRVIISVHDMLRNREGRIWEAIESLAPDVLGALPPKPLG